MKGPLRSFLFVPANDTRKVEKAFASDADMVILDLEDAVAISEKAKARSLVVDVLSRERREGVCVRVNGIDTPWIAGDLMAVVGNRPEGIMLPKAESAEDIRKVDWLISQLEADYGISDKSVALFPLVETALGVDKAYEVAASSERIKKLAFGAVDFTLDLGVSLSKGGAELFFARSQLAIASRAAGIEGPIDTVFTRFKDEKALKEDCRVGRELGFTGKLVIHPAQIQAVHDAFSPEPGEITYASKVVRAFEKAESEGIAAIQLDGKFIDYPVVARARQTLSIARDLDLWDGTYPGE